MSKYEPSLTLPTSDFAQMQGMSNRRLVDVLRTSVLAEDRAGHFSPKPPAEYDAYRVVQRVGCIDIHLLSGGTAVFCCKLVPAGEY